MSAENKKEYDTFISTLNDDESIIWSFEGRVSISICVIQGLLPMIALLVFIVIIGSLGEMGPGALMFSFIFSWIGLVGLILLLGYSFFLVIQMNRTWYHFTNQRFLETRGASIVKEIPRENLNGVDQKEFLRQSLSHRSPGEEYLNYYVTDPVSGTVIRITATREDIPDIMKRWISKGKIW